VVKGWEKGERTSPRKKERGVGQVPFLQRRKQKGGGRKTLSELMKGGGERKRSWRNDRRGNQKRKTRLKRGRGRKISKFLIRGGRKDKIGQEEALFRNEEGKEGGKKEPMVALTNG